MPQDATLFTILEKTSTTKLKKKGSKRAPLPQAFTSEEKISLNIIYLNPNRTPLGYFFNHRDKFLPKTSKTKDFI
jgi:hypothetical protein